MTYCVAWKSANSIFFAADSSVTSNNSLFTSRPKLKSIPSSFNEYSRHPNGKYTEEAIIKILTFKNSVAVSFAGDLKDISATLDVFRRALEYNSNPHTALTTAVNSSAPAESIHRASIIIGYLEEGKPILLCYNKNGDRKIREIDSIVQIGSGANQFRVFTHDIIKKLLDRNLYDYQFLPLVSALLQNFGVHNNLVSLKSGGTFYGVRIDINGIEWQPDTVYVIYGHRTGFQRFHSNTTGCDSKDG